MKQDIVKSKEELTMRGNNLLGGSKIMKVHELNRPQLESLKQTYMFDCCEVKGIIPSTQTIAQTDTLISDEEIFNIFEGLDFKAEYFEYGEDGYEYADEFSELLKEHYEKIELF